jgi:CBS domain-containing protein
MGSEGRFEQTFHTDQDNGLIFSAESPREAEDLRRLFLPMAKEVNQNLDLCGIPHCTGGIMAGNAECCLSLEEWKERFYGWIRTPDQQALINATIFSTIGHSTVTISSRKA